MTDRHSLARRPDRRRSDSTRARADSASGLRARASRRAVGARTAVQRRVGMKSEGPQSVIQESRQASRRGRSKRWRGAGLTVPIVPKRAKRVIASPDRSTRFAEPAAISCDCARALSSRNIGLSRTKQPPACPQPVPSGAAGRRRTGNRRPGRRASADDEALRHTSSAHLRPGTHNGTLSRIPRRRRCRQARFHDAWCRDHPRERCNRRNYPGWASSLSR